MQGNAAVSEAVSAYADLLKQRLGRVLDSVLLFGSRARGDETVRSDVDVAVVVDDSADMPATRRLASDTAYPFVVDGYDIKPLVIRKRNLADPSYFAASLRKDAKKIA